jgi:hypothetical protein
LVLEFTDQAGFRGVLEAIVIETGDEERVGL